MKRLLFELYQFVVVFTRDLQPFITPPNTIIALFHLQTTLCSPHNRFHVVWLQFNCSLAVKQGRTENNLTSSYTRLLIKI